MRDLLAAQQTESGEIENSASMISFWSKCTWHWACNLAVCGRECDLDMKITQACFPINFTWYCMCARGKKKQQHILSGCSAAREEKSAHSFHTHTRQNEKCISPFFKHKRVLYRDSLEIGLVSAGWRPIRLIRTPETWYSASMCVPAETRIINEKTVQSDDGSSRLSMA